MKIIRVVDLETSGDAPPEHGVVEVGFTDLWSTTINTVGEPAGWMIMGGKSSLVDPGRPIPAETSAVHHLIDNDVRGAPSWAVASAMISGSDVVAYAAHGAKFEQTWIGPDLTEGKPWICTYKCALRLWPDLPRHSNQAVRYARQPIGLDRSFASPAHRALPDSYVTAHHVRDMLELATLADLVKWSAEPALLPICRIGKWRNGGAGTPWSEVDSGFLAWVLDKDFDEDTVHTCRHHLDRREEEQREEQRLYTAGMAQKRATLAGNEPSIPSDVSDPEDRNDG